MFFNAFDDYLYGEVYEPLTDYVEQRFKLNNRQLACTLYVATVLTAAVPYRGMMIIIFSAVFVAAMIWIVMRSPRFSRAINRAGGKLSRIMICWFNIGLCLWPVSDLVYYLSSFIFSVLYVSAFYISDCEGDGPRFPRKQKREKHNTLQAGGWNWLPIPS